MVDDIGTLSGLCPIFDICAHDVLIELQYKTGTGIMIHIPVDLLVGVLLIILYFN